MKTIKLDIKELNEYKHDYLINIFSLPDYYGRNFDAFYDCLTDLNKIKVEIINQDCANEFSTKIINILTSVDNVIF